MQISPHPSVDNYTGALCMRMAVVELSMENKINNKFIYALKMCVQAA